MQILVVRRNERDEERTGVGSAKNGRRRETREAECDRRCVIEIRKAAYCVFACTCGWVRAACVYTYIHTFLCLINVVQATERDREPYWPVGVARLQEDGNNREFVRYHAFLTHL